MGGMIQNTTSNGERNMLMREPIFLKHRVVDYNPPTERVYRLPVDAYTTEDAIVLTASVPGMTADALNITLDGDVLVIRGELNGAVENASYVLRERFHGKFERRLTIAVPVNIAAAEATVENGVMTLVLPKAEEARPHRIAVRTAE